MAGPVISVIVPTYCPGEGFDRVLASLDVQTLPQAEFETLVVDDGSPDGTADRIQALAATRPNLRVQRIENSGWPSRPRNVALESARGEWVLFMDHDDSLYPDALARLAEVARRTGADVVSPKESKTNDPWWGMEALREGTVLDARTSRGIEALLPMVPHKLYRRAFLDEHAIRFPEGRRRLWEDIFVNVAAWRHARTVVVLADAPVYLWHSGASNNSRSYGPTTEEYWDRLDELLAFIDEALADEPEARRTMLLHQWRVRVLGRAGRALRGATEEEAALLLSRARAVAERWVPPEEDATLGPLLHLLGALVRAGDAESLVALPAPDARGRASVQARSAAWRAGVLHLTLEARWLAADGSSLRVHHHDDRLIPDLPEGVRAPDEVADLHGALESLVPHIGVRDRDALVTWEVPVAATREWEAIDGGAMTPLLRIEAVIDPRTAAAGGPLPIGVHDVEAQVEWGLAFTNVPVTIQERRARPAVVDGTPAVAYRTTKGLLAIDTSSRLRNVVADGGLEPGRLEGTTRSLTIPLPRLSEGDGRLPAAVRLVDGDHEHVLPGEVSGDHLHAGSARRVPPGEYDVAFAVGGGPFLGGKRRARVHLGGGVTILPRPNDPPLPPTTADRLRDRLGVRRR